MTRPRTKYPTDFTDKQWRQIEQLLPLEKWGGRPRTVDFREVLNAIFYREEVGCSWRMLPHDFPPWNTVYGYYRRWNHDGTLSKLWRIIIQRTSRSVHRPPERESESPGVGHSA